MLAFFMPVEYQLYEYCYFAKVVFFFWYMLNFTLLIVPIEGKAVPYVHANP